jgi:hypothetical protein
MRLLMNMRRLIPILIAAAVLLPAGAAHANSSQFTTFEAPVQLLNDSTRDATLAELQGLGVKSIRTLVTWKDVAPSPDATTKPSFDASDPNAYNWGIFDRLVSAARARGMRLYFTLTGPVPVWATQGKSDHVTRPLASEFQQFAAAAGKHFGASVSWWSIWNEPNHPLFLDPQYVHGKPYSGKLYRGLLTAGISGLRSAGITAPILMGETAPAGSTHDVAPLTFLRQALCLSSSYHKSKSCGKVDVDGYAQHPYTTAGGPFHVPPREDVMIGVLSRLTSALDKAARARAIPSHLPVYLTEFGVQSFPDRIAGVTLAKQSDYRSISEWIAYHNPRVKSFSQYLLVDSAPDPSAPSFARYPGFESGLYLYVGQKRKPVYDSFRLPLVARQRGHSVSLWGLVRPATGPGTVTVLYARAHSSKYHTLKRVHYSSSGYWTASTRYSKGTRYRVRWRDASGQVFTGPPTAIYRF